MKITFLNWDKYNKRQKDIKRPFWFALSNGIFLDPFYADLDLYERQAFLYLLCEASRQNKYGEVEVSERLFEQITGLKCKSLRSVIDKLLKSKAAAGWRQDGGGIATATGQNKTEHNKTEHTHVNSADADVGVLSNVELTSRVLCMDIVSVWNETVSNIPKIQTLNEKRTKLVKQRINECKDISLWRSAIKMLDQSDWSNGKKNGWKATFDYLIRGDKFLLLIEQASSTGTKKLKHQVVGGVDC